VLKQRRSFLVPLACSLLALACAACGGAPPPDAAHAGSQHDEHAEAHEALPPALHAFHEALAPVWHSAPGDERVSKTCAADAELTEKAAPTSDADLVAATAAVAKACADYRAATLKDAHALEPVETALAKVHHRFHELAEH
jgi:hypothetical protein